MEIDHVIYEIKSEKFCGTRKHTALIGMLYELSVVDFFEILKRKVSWILIWALRIKAYNQM